MSKMPWGKLAALGLLGGGAALTATGAGAPVGLAMMGAGAGIGKDEWIDKPRRARQLALAAETQRLSPWTGLVAQMPQEGSGFESGMQGALAGAQMGQGWQNTQANMAQSQALADLYKAEQASALAGATPGAASPKVASTAPAQNWDWEGDNSAGFTYEGQLGSYGGSPTITPRKPARKPSLLASR